MGFIAFIIRRLGLAGEQHVLSRQGNCIRLKDVYDIAGNLWWHEYDGAGRLARLESEKTCAVRKMLRLSPADDGSFTLVEVRGINKGRPRLLEDALKTTAAYSAERQTHFRMVGTDRLEAW